MQFRRFNMYNDYQQVRINKLLESDFKTQYDLIPDAYKENYYFQKFLFNLADIYGQVLLMDENDLKSPNWKIEFTANPNSTIVECSWFSKEHTDKRRIELNELTANLDELQQIYEKKQDLFPAVVELLKANDGILQSEFKHLFDEPFQNDVSNILYHLHKEGKLERIKEGRTYILHFRG